MKRQIHIQRLNSAQASMRSRISFFSIRSVPSVVTLVKTFARASLLGGLGLALFGLASCSEVAGQRGVQVSVPSVYVNCTTSQCRTNSLPRILVIFTTSGCDLPDFGSTISAATESMNCNGTSGCYGQITNWIDADGLAVNTLPSGSYSICARIDYNRDYPSTATGDSIGVLDNVTVGPSTASQFVVDWTDL